MSCGDPAHLLQMGKSSGPSNRDIERNPYRSHLLAGHTFHWNLLYDKRMPPSEEVRGMCPCFYHLGPRPRGRVWQRMLDHRREDGRFRVRVYAMSVTGGRYPCWNTRRCLVAQWIIRLFQQCPTEESHLEQRAETRWWQGKTVRAGTRQTRWGSGQGKAFEPQVQAVEAGIRGGKVDGRASRGGLEGVPLQGMGEKVKQRRITGSKPQNAEGDGWKWGLRIEGHGRCLRKAIPSCEE